MDPVSVIVQGAMYPRGTPSAHGLPAWGLAVRQGECLPSTHGPARPRSTSAGSSPVDTNSPLVPASENTRLPVLVFHRHSLGKGLFSVWSRNSPASGAPWERPAAERSCGSSEAAPSPRPPRAGRSVVEGALVPQSSPFWPWRSFSRVNAPWVPRTVQKQWQLTRFSVFFLSWTFLHFH